MSVLSRVPDKWRERLDHWPFWMGIAYFGLTVLIVWLFFVAQHTAQVQARQAQAEAIRQASVRSTADSTYRRCIDSIEPTERVSTHVAGVNEAFSVLLENSRAALEVTPRSDPLYKVRVANIHRLERAIRKVAAIKAFPVPTRAACEARKREALKGGGG